MTHDQWDLLLQVIRDSTHVIAWIAGIVLSIFVATVGGALGIIFKMYSAKIDDAKREAALSREMATNVQEAVGTMTAHCSEMRGACRESMITKYVDKMEFKDMESEFKRLVQSVLERLGSDIRENRKMVMNKLDDLKKAHENFESSITNTVQGHSHPSDGKDGVIFRNRSG